MAAAAARYVLPYEYMYCSRQYAARFVRVRRVYVSNVQCRLWGHRDQNYGSSMYGQQLYRYRYCSHY